MPESFEALLDRLQTDVLEQCLDGINSRAERWLRRPQGERLPSNQRNLTDARTRIGALLEYFLFEVLGEHPLDAWCDRAGRFWTYVSHNAYPDFCLRDANGEPVLRFEVKCLQTVSEEPSANFDALVQEVRQDCDVVACLIWEWESTEEAGWLYPHVERAYVFDAHALARLRDLAWLDSPAEGRPKLIDFDQVLVWAKSKGYKVEERNLGKLTRIANDPPEALRDLLASRGVRLHAEFVSYLAYSGGCRIARRLYAASGGNPVALTFAPFPLASGAPLAAPPGAVFLLQDDLRWRQSLQTVVDDLPAGGVLVRLNAKFESRIHLRDGRVESCHKPEEAEAVLSRLRSQAAVRLP